MMDVSKVNNINLFNNQMIINKDNLNNHKYKTEYLFASKKKV